MRRSLTPSELLSTVDLNLQERPPAPLNCPPVVSRHYPSLLSVQSSDGYAGVHALHTLYRYLRQTYSLESLLADSSSLPNI